MLTIARAARHGGANYFGMSFVLESSGTAGVATPPLAGLEGPELGAVPAGGWVDMTPGCAVPCEEYHDNPKLVTKKTAARTAVVRLKKLAEPLDPKILPEAPPPNAAPISAPFPCCSNTRPIMPSAAIK